MSAERKPRFRWIPAEPRVLVALGALAGLLLLLAKIIEDVVQRESGVFDRNILLALRKSADLANPIGPIWLKSALLDVTSLGSPTIITLLTVIATAYLLVTRNVRTAILVAVSIGGGGLAEKAMKIGFDRPRPDIVPHFVAVHSLSFPSSHAMLSALTYLTLGALLARADSRRLVRGFLLGVGVFMTLLVGFSRVYLGVHWPTDVLGGWMAGSAWALTTWLVAERLAPVLRAPEPGLDGPSH